MAPSSLTSGVTTVLLTAFVAAAAVSGCAGARSLAGAKPAVEIKVVNPEGWTIHTDKSGKTICREHRSHGVLNDDGKNPAVIRFDAATGKVTGEEHWRNGRRAEPPLPFAPRIGPGL
jgi:hypothetical protein